LADTTQELGPFKGGRPFKFTDPAELRRLIQNYFDFCDPHIETRVVDGGTNQRGETIWHKREVMTPQKSYTTSGLARALGTTRQTLLEYQQVDHYTDEISDEVRQELIDAIGDAKRRVEEFAESQLFEGNANGAKFNLTNNHGWVERSIVENPGGLFGQANTLKIEMVQSPTIEPEPLANNEGTDVGEDDQAQPDSDSGVPAPE
jgi:DNA-packaging protein gp3